MRVVDQPAADGAVGVGGKTDPDTAYWAAKPVRYLSAVWYMVSPTRFAIGVTTDDGGGLVVAAVQS